MKKVEVQCPSKPPSSYTSSYRCGFYSLAVASLVVLALSVFMSSYFFNELKCLQQKVAILEKEGSSRDTPASDGGILLRQERQSGGPRGAAGQRGSREAIPTGSPGPKGQRGFASSVVFIHWGSLTCPPASDGNLYDHAAGTVAAFHDLSNNVVVGSEMFCITNENSISSAKPLTQGLKLQPVQFNLYDHSDFFTSRNMRGYLSCVHCFIETSNVITVIGRDCKQPEWQRVYHGYITTSFSYFGTSQSICVSLSSESPVPSGSLFPSSSTRSMVPVISGNFPPGTTPQNKRIPCNVCYRKLDEGQKGMRYENKGVDGRRGMAGATGQRGAEGSA